MPTLFRSGNLRFFFYSNDHEPIHVHVECGDGAAKIQLWPEIEVVENHLRAADLKRATTIVRKHADTFRRQWHEHFGN